MENRLKIEFEKINPYLRYVNRLVGATREEHIVPWRILYDYEIIFVTKGVLVVDTLEKRFKVEESCFHIMPPFIEHTQMIPENILTDYFTVHMDFTLNDIADDFDAVEVFREPCEMKLKTAPIYTKLLNREVYSPAGLDIFESYRSKSPSLFTELFIKLYTEFNKNTLYGRLNAKSAMLRILSELFFEMEREDSGDKNDGIVPRFIEHIMSHYDKFVDLNEIVYNYGISLSRFRAIFKEKTRKSPHEYLIDYRIEQAKKLLLSRKYTISEVCFMVGYDDIHYFSKLFKLKEKQNPSNWLKENT